METSSSKDRPKRQVKKPEFETDPEVQVERSIRYQYRNTLFCFFYQKACVSTTLNSKAWPRGYSDEDKIALKPRESEFIRHNRGTHRMLYLGQGPADEVRLHKKLTSERVKRGLPPTFLSCVSPELNSKPKKSSVTQLPVDFVPESPSFFSQDSPLVATASNLQDETAAVIVEAPISAREENAVVPRLLFQEKAVVSADKKVTKANLICFQKFVQ